MSFKVQTNMEVLTTRLENDYPIKDNIDIDDKIVVKIKTYLLSNRNAIAIASNQLFSNHRVFGMWYEGKIKIFINPRIRYDYIAQRGKHYEYDTSKELEGCMSISNGNKKYLVERIELIYVLSENHGLEKYQGYDARVIQHEIDHLEGITIKCRHKGQN